MPELHAWEGFADPATGELRQYVCSRCWTEIPAVAVLVHPDEAEAMRAAAPDRLIWSESLQRRGEITMIDARDLARWSGKPPCTPHLELEAS